jgi:hypothetical protein
MQDPAAQPSAVFFDHVAEKTRRAKQQGATHALLVHMADSVISNYVALKIDDVVEVYRDQLDRWPQRARNTKTPTLYFEDSRKLRDAECVSVVEAREVPLEALSVLAPVFMHASSEPATRKITAEIELRLKQRAFRLRVGVRCGWRCAVSGTAIPEVLDAAHLPGRDWRNDNAATDGILLRADLHRLLDRGLAVISDGKFLIAEPARAPEYTAFHGRSIAAYESSPAMPVFAPQLAEVER